QARPSRNRLRANGPNKAILLGTRARRHTWQAVRNGARQAEKPQRCVCSREVTRREGCRPTSELSGPGRPAVVNAVVSGPAAHSRSVRQPGGAADGTMK